MGRKQASRAPIAVFPVPVSWNKVSEGHASGIGTRELAEGGGVDSAVYGAVVIGGHWTDPDVQGHGPACHAKGSVIVMIRRTFCILQRGGSTDIADYIFVVLVLEMV